MSRPAEFWYAYMNPPINPIRPPVTIDGPLIPGLIPKQKGETVLNIYIHIYTSLPPHHVDPKLVVEYRNSSSLHKQNQVRIVGYPQTAHNSSY